MIRYQIEAGASTDQSISARTQAYTCTAIIPSGEAARLMVTMPPMSAEQAFWMRKASRALRRELARREAERHERITDMLVSLVTAAATAFILYAFLFVGCL